MLDVSLVVTVQGAAGDLTGVTSRGEERTPMAQSTNEIYWLTARQVAAHYGVSLRTVDRWTESGTLKAYRIGSVRRFKVTDVVKMPRRIVAAR